MLIQMEAGNDNACESWWCKIVLDDESQYEDTYEGIESSEQMGVVGADGVEFIVD